MSLRGGAPFLSGVDSRLLLRWLDNEVPVPVILHALEQAAERRRSRRVRTPLSLRNAEGVVKKLLSAKVERPPALAAPTGSLAPLVESLRASELPAERQVAEDLAALQGEGEDLVEAALAVSRAFFERRWAEGPRERWMAGAQEELAELEDSMKGGAFQRMVEEVARDRMRQEHPQLSATRIWDTVSP